jgi:CheY-like chemotaxis protein
VLALSSNAQAEDCEASLAAGLDDLLVKPLDRERLRQLLDAAPGRHLIRLQPDVGFRTLP